MRGCNPIFDFARLRPPTAPNKMRATSKLNFLSVANKMRRPRKFQRNLRAPKGSAQSAPAVGKFIFNFIGRLRRRDFITPRVRARAEDFL